MLINLFEKKSKITVEKKIKWDKQMRTCSQLLFAVRAIITENDNPPARNHSAVFVIIF